MKLHKITYCMGAKDHQEFAASDSEASKRCTELKKTHGISGKRGPIDIPTDKSGLIDWLNKNAMLVAK